MDKQPDSNPGSDPKPSAPTENGTKSTHVAVDVPSVPYIMDENYLPPPNDNYKMMPNDYTVWSLINIIFFGTILGFIAFYYSVQTRDYYFTGNYRLAKKASRNAFFFNNLSLMVGFFEILFGIILSMTIAMRPY